MVLCPSHSALRGLALAGLAALAGTAHAGDVNPALAAAAQREGRVEALIVLKDQRTPASAQPAPGAADDYKARRRALVAALRDRADTQQRGLRAWLDARGIEHRPFWIANLVVARLSAGELAALAARDEVGRIEPNPSIAVALPQRGSGAAPADVPGVASGVEKIRAPLVWAAGFTGQGVVIAGQDTGYHWQHPALKAQYRGWNGSTADHNYHWHDAIHSPNGSCPANSPQPCDDNGHGTHTAGTFAGDDQASRQIGVAPGAQWIGCRNMNAGNGTPASYIECMQWLLAPTNLQNQNPDPDRAPDIVNNSWGCPPSEGCTVGTEIKAAVNHLVKGGILFVAAAGNAGPSCSSIFDPPGTYPLSFTVGATDNADQLADFSSRGPVAKVKGVKPDVSAPGVNITSAVPPNGYLPLSGTSMASPHVAGAAALLMSAVPALKGNPAAVEKLLRQTAQREGVSNPLNQTCGGTTASQWPNHLLGYGRIDVYAAYQKATTAALDLSGED